MDKEIKAVVVGGGPAGLMAADVLSRAGVAVDLFDAMPSVGRKFLLAGKGGLNLTHAEPADVFETRFGARRSHINPWLQDFGPQQIRAWATSLGVETFVGSSGRVFPTDMKAAPLLRAWLHRLRVQGVRFYMRHRWVGWGTDSGGPGAALRFESPQGEVQVPARAVVLALGGASWPRLGSDGAWAALLARQGVEVAPLLPANCGFNVALGDRDGWSPFFAGRFAGLPFKSVALQVNAPVRAEPPVLSRVEGVEATLLSHDGTIAFSRKGEFVATASGVEGSLVYAASALLRDAIAAEGRAVFHIDLLPDVPAAKVLAEVRHPRGSRSLSSHLKSRLHLDGIKMAVLVEVLGKDGMGDATRLAAAIKHLPITVHRPRPVAEAISTAGGVRFEGLSPPLMLQRLPGVFCAGEMLDWEAPTGGYLLTACLSSGRVAAQGVLRYLSRDEGH